MTNNRPKGFGIIGTASRQVGAFAGKATATGRSIVRLGTGAVTAAGNLLRRPIEAPVTAASEHPAARHENRVLSTEQPGQTTSLIATVGAMKSDLSDARRELTEARSDLEKRQIELASQIQALQKEKGLLLAELEGIRREPAETRPARGSVALGGSEQIREGRDTQVAVLEANLNIAQQELTKARSEAKSVQTEFQSEIALLQEEKESLASELNEARHEFEQARDREDAIKARVNAMESSIAALRSELEEKARGREFATSETTSEGEDLLTEQEAEVSESPQRQHQLEYLSDKGTAPPVEPVPAQAREEKGRKARASHKRIAEKATVLTPEEAEKAIFAGAAEKVVFTRALVDIADRHAAARCDAAKAIGAIRHELSARVLTAQLQRDPSPEVRQECVKALTTLGMAEGYSAVERALSDDAAVVRLAAIWGVYRLSGTKGMSALKNMLSDPDEGVRRRAAACIGWLGKEELAPVLLPLLNDSSPAVRRTVVEAMSNLRSRRAVSALIERLNDPNRSVATAALQAIETITGNSMSKSFPAKEKSRQLLAIRWKEWWKEQYAK